MPIQSFRNFVPISTPLCPLHIRKTPAAFVEWILHQILSGVMNCGSNPLDITVIKEQCKSMHLSELPVNAEETGLKVGLHFIKICGKI